MSSFRHLEESKAESQQDGSDDLQWQAAVARARHRTYEVPLPSPAPAMPHKRWRATALSCAFVAIVAGAYGAFVKQDYERRIEAKDRLLSLTEEQKSTAQSQRDQAFSELAASKAEMAAKIATLRAERNAALNLSPTQADGSGEAAAKPAPVPRMPTKISIPDDPLLGLSDAQGDLRPKRKAHKRGSR